MIEIARHVIWKTRQEKEAGDRIEYEIKEKKDERVERERAVSPKVDNEFPVRPLTTSRDCFIPLPNPILHEILNLIILIQTP